MKPYADLITLLSLLSHVMSTCLVKRSKVATGLLCYYQIAYKRVRPAFDRRHKAPSSRLILVLYTPLRLLNVSKEKNPIHCCSIGSATSIFILESILEHVAKELGKAPEEVRYVNLYQQGQTTPQGQRLEYCNLSSLWNQLLRSADFERRRVDVETFNRVSNFCTCIVTLS